MKSEDRAKGKILKVYGLLIFADLLNADHAVAQTATDEALARSALTSACGPGSQEVLERRLLSNKESLVAEHALRQGLEEEIVAATVVFKKRYTSHAVESFAEEYELEIASAHAKAQTHGNGAVSTLSIGSRTLLLLEQALPLSARLDMAVSNQQRMLLQAAAADTSGEYRGIRPVACTSERPFYRVDVIATQGAVVRLMDDPGVAAAVVDKSGALLSSYHSLKARMSQLKVSSWRNLPGDPGDSPRLALSRLLIPIH